MALPTIVFKQIWRNRTTSKSIALGQLINGALFFGMRSCEYSSVTGKRKTKKLQIKDIRFFHYRKEIKKSPNNLQNLQQATSVSVTFTKQKNNVRYATITQQRSGQEICPVTTWAHVVSRVLSYPDTNSESYVDLFLNQDGTLSSVKAMDIAEHLKATVTVIGKDALGFKAD